MSQCSFARFLFGLLLIPMIVGIAGERTRNYGLHVVPAAKTVKIDGDLKDWDLSGQYISCKDAPELVDSQSCRVAGMWDEQNLYMSFVFRDSTPLQNHWDPKTHGSHSWEGDCVQLRFRINKFFCHLNMWYHTPKKQPAMYVTYQRFMPPGQKAQSMNVDRPANPLQAGAEMAFQLAKDGKGYTQEVKIPWSAITRDGKCPGAGAKDMRMGMELFWSRIRHSGMFPRLEDNLAPGTITVGRFWQRDSSWGPLLLRQENSISLPMPDWQKKLLPEPKGTVSVPIELKQDSYVTLAVNDARGNRVRCWQAAKRLTKGKHVLQFDALSDENEPLPPGTYQWEGIARDQIDVRWLMSYYMPNSTPWKTNDGTGGWGPDHANLRTVVPIRKDLLFLGGIVSEAGDGSVFVDETGAKQGFAGEGKLAAVVGDTVYRLSNRFNNIGVANARTFRPDTIKLANGKMVSEVRIAPQTDAILGMAATEAGVFFSVRSKQDDKAVHQLRRHDLKTLAKLDEWTAPVSGPMALRADGTLLLAAATGVFAADPTTGKMTSVYEKDFGAAIGLTVAPQGNVFVGLGAPRHQIVLLSPQGKGFRETGRLGKAGGRTLAGFYDPTEGFFEPSGLGVDSQGRLWVAEDIKGCKRVSIWDWQQKKWLKDFIGGTYYGGGGMINPLDPTEAFYSNMVFKIDLDTGDWKLKQVGLLGPGRAVGDTTPAHGQGHAKPAVLNVANYGITPGTADQLLVCKGRSYLAQHRGHLARIYRKRPNGLWALCVWLNYGGKVRSGRWRKTVWKSIAPLLWVDRNDDFEVQTNEITQGKVGECWGANSYWGNGIGPDLSIYARAITPPRNLKGAKRKAFKTHPAKAYRVQSFTKGGTPIYDRKRFDIMPNFYAGTGLSDGTFFAEGGKLSKLQPEKTTGQTKYWYRGEKTQRWTDRMPEPGVLIAMNKHCGVAPSPVGDLVAFISDNGQRYLVTGDGLYVDQLMQDSRSQSDPWPKNPKRGVLVNNMAPGGESFCGWFCRLKDGRYLLTTGFLDCRVLQVEGIDSLRRLPGGSFTVTKADVARAREIQAFRLNARRITPRTEIAKRKQAFTVDGKLDDWNGVKPLALPTPIKKGGLVRYAWDAKNLYVVWQVQDKTPMKNMADRWEHAFKDDAVDLMFRPTANNIDSRKLLVGDCRILFTRQRGKDLGILYRPKSKTPKSYRFDAFEGANRQNAHTMQEVRQLTPKDLQYAISRSQTGYVVEAAIPWDLLGGRPDSGNATRMDFGALLGDPAGGRVANRVYWSNRNTAIVSDIPSEARLEPAQWGIVTFSD